MVGVPTVYTPTIGVEVYELMAQGFSIVGAAGKLGIGRQTIYDWTHKYPEFAALMEKAKAARQAHWEQEALETTSGPRVTMITKALGGMRSPDWSDDSRIELTGKDGEALFNQITFAILDSREPELKTIDHEVLSEDE